MFVDAKGGREKARQENWKTVLLVTSAYHTRRALDTFERVLADENVKIGVVAALSERDTPAFYWWLTADGWNWVTSEYVKSFYYWVYY